LIAVHASVASLNGTHAVPAVSTTHLVSVIAEKQLARVAVYPAQVSYFSIQSVYAAFTEQTLPPVLIPLQYDEVKLTPVTVLQLPAANAVRP
jgi:hypothetical protein